MTNTRNTPMEALERALPMRVRGAAAAARGGRAPPPAVTGSSGSCEVLVDATVSLITERRVSAPWGLAAVEPGRAGRTGCCPAGVDEAAGRPARQVTLELRAGDVIRMLTPGGGGWGSPG